MDRGNPEDTAPAMSAVRVLLLPGWLDSGPGHWQTLWQQQHGWERVVQADWLWPRRGDWMARLDEVLMDPPAAGVARRPVLLAAHSLGCQLVAAWAAHSRHTDRVRAALLVAPPDTERADVPPQLSGWRPMVRNRLPFRSHVIYSDDDPYGAADVARLLAAHWGSSAESAGPCGHINAESGLGLWPLGLQRLAELGQT